MPITSARIAAALLACAALPAAAQPYGFEGIWMSVENCTEPARSAEYFSDPVRFNILHGCEFDRVEKVAPQRWKIDATCLVSFTEADEDGEAVRHNRDVENAIELHLYDNGRCMTETITYDKSLGHDKPEVTEHYRCKECIDGIMQEQRAREQKKKENSR